MAGNRGRSFDAHTSMCWQDRQAGLFSIVTNRVQGIGREDERSARNCVEAEKLGQFSQRGRSNRFNPAAGKRQQPQRRLGTYTRRPQGRQPGVAVALGQPPAIGPDHQRHMNETGRRQAERVIQQELSGC